MYSGSLEKAESKHDNSGSNRIMPGAALLTENLD
jgi:hypothetical protein